MRKHLWKAMNTVSWPSALRPSPLCSLGAPSKTLRTWQLERRERKDRIRKGPVERDLVLVPPASIAYSLVTVSPRGGSLPHSLFVSQEKKRRRKTINTLFTLRIGRRWTLTGLLPLRYLGTMGIIENHFPRLKAQDLQAQGPSSSSHRIRARNRQGGCWVRHSLAPRS